MKTKHDVRADAMAKLHADGFTLAAIGRSFGCTPQAVHKALKKRELLTRHKSPPLPFVVFGGKRFTRRKTGYYACTARDITLLHRAVWMATHGEIPAGFDVHHKNEDKADNRIENLELKRCAKHAGDHMRQKWAKGIVRAEQQTKAYRTKR